MTASWAESSSHSALGSSPCHYQALRLSQSEASSFLKHQASIFSARKNRHMEIIVNLFLFIVRKPMRYNGM